MSMVAELLSELRQRNVSLWLEGDRLRYRAAKDALTPELLSQVKHYKADISAFLREATAAASQQRPEIVAVDRNRPLPLSFAQQRLWFLHQFEPDSSSNNMPVVVRFTGKLDIPLLEQSLREVVRRHEVLRTTFPAVKGQPTIAIASEPDIELAIVDLRQMPLEQAEEAAHQLATEAARQPFDLATGPMVRLTLFRLRDDRHLLLWNMHCISCDGTSSDIFYQDLAAIYAALHAGKAPLPDLPLHYADFAHWQREWLQGEVLESHLTYWKQQLGGSLSALKLPTDFPRPPLVQTYQGDRYARMLPKPLMESLSSLSQKLGTTLFTTLLATFQTLLHRYSDQDDVLLSFVSSGRNQVEVERVMGFFSNTLILRTNFADNPTFRELLQRVHRTALDAQAHQDLPFEKLVEEIGPMQAASRSPLFQIKFALNPPWTNGRGMAAIQLPDLTIESLFGYIYHGKTKFDLALVMREQEQGLGAVFDYNAELFNASTIARMMDHLQLLLEGIAANLDQRISDLPLLKPDERYQLLEWNDTQAAYPDVGLHQQFEAQAERTPNAIALVAEAPLTYRELNQRSNQLAHFLREQGVGPEVPVALYVDWSIDLAVGILGVLKAGGIVVPLDRDLDPQERLAKKLHQAQPRVILISAQSSAALPAHSAQVVAIDGDVIARYSPENLPEQWHLDTPAFVLFTGSKGVRLTHRNLTSHGSAIAQTFELTDRDRVLPASREFSALLEALFAWNCGAAVALQDDRLTTAELLQTIKQQQITVLMLPTSRWHTLVQDLSLEPQPLPQRLRLVVASGEPASGSVYATWRSLVGQSLRWLNTYGTIETTATAVVADPESSAIAFNQSQAVLGRPLANVQTYVLDRHLQPVPIGTSGELYIGGTGVCQGYLNPSLTTERLIANPFSKEPASRLYKTGERVRFLPNGTLEWIDHLDRRVTVRGFPVELDEIVAVLQQHPAVQQAAIVDRPTPGDSALDGYVVPAPDAVVVIDDLYDFLQQKLPAYMLPTQIVLLESLPLTATGDLDRRALPDPTHAAAPKIPVTFRDDLEQQLTQLWESVFEMQPIGIRDNFFEIGGHSLLAVRLFAQIEKVFDRILPLSVLLHAPTIEQLAQILRGESEPSAWSPLVTIQAGNPDRSPLFCIHGGGFNVLVYRSLAVNLGPEQTVYGLQARGLDGTPIADRIEDIAMDYVQHIQKVQPQGPYYLAGLSKGGNIALEMAQQLQAQGQEVALLAMFDSYGPDGIKLLPPAPRLLSSLAYVACYSLPRFTGKMRSLEPSTVLKTVQKALHRSNNHRHPKHPAEAEPATPITQPVTPFDQQPQGWMDRISQYVLDHSPWSFLNPSTQLQTVDSSLSDTFKKLELSYGKVYKAYTPKPYAGKIVLLQAMELPPGYRLTPYLGWGTIAEKGVEVHKIPGHHTSLMESPILAEKLATYLPPITAEQTGAKK